MLTLRPILLTTLFSLLTVNQPLFSETITATAAANLYEAQTKYNIYRKSKNIGTHTLTFKPSDSTLTVITNSTIKVTALKIPLFRFKYDSTEVWKNDRLHSVDTSTKTGSKLEQSSLLNDGESSQLTNDAGESTVPRIAYATNHWNINTVDQAILFNTVKGVASKIKVENLGIKELTISGRTFNATHYVYTGDINAQTWYDENDRWVKLAFLGADGNEVIYAIDKP